MISLIFFYFILFFSGGTAVGTGLNARIGFAEKAASAIADHTGEYRKKWDLLLSYHRV